MLQNLTGWHALIVLAVILLLFGAAKLPALARSVGQSMRILKDEVHSDRRTQPEHATFTDDATPVDGHAPRPVAVTPSREENRAS